MGQAAKTNIRIEFKDGISVPLDITSKTALEQSLRKFFRNSRNNDLTVIDITITEFELFDNEVELELYSTRRVNLDFQLNLLKEYLEVYHGDIIEEINYDTWVQQ